MNRIIVSVEEKVGHPRDWERTKVGKNPEGTPNGVGGGVHRETTEAVRDPDNP